MADKGKGKVIKIDAERCKGCLLCVDICPVKILKLSEKVNKKGHRYVVATEPVKCTGCSLCVTMCPDCSIEIREKE